MVLLLLRLYGDENVRLCRVMSARSHLLPVNPSLVLYNAPLHCQTKLKGQTSRPPCCGLSISETHGQPRVTLTQTSKDPASIHVEPISSSARVVLCNRPGPFVAVSPLHANLSAL